MDKKTLRNDIILIASLLLVAIISLIIVFSLRSNKENKYANVYVQNEVSFSIDLQEDEEKDYPVYAFNSEKVLLTIHRIDHGVKVITSTCPHKDTSTSFIVSSPVAIIQCSPSTINALASTLSARSCMICLYSSEAKQASSFSLDGKRMTITLSRFLRGLRARIFSVRTRYSPPKFSTIGFTFSI